MKETHDINSLLTLLKIFLASQHKKQPNKSLSIFDADSDLKVRALHYAELLPLEKKKKIPTSSMQDSNPKIEFFFDSRRTHLGHFFQLFGIRSKWSLFFNLMWPLNADHLNLHELTEAKQRG